MRPWLVALGLAILCCPPLRAEDPAAEIQDHPQAQDEAAWAVVEAARGTTVHASALDELLKSHPHGPLAARARLAQSQAQDNLLEAAALLRLARGEDPKGPVGARAALELARLEYQQGRPESALLALEEAEEAERPAEIQADWLYWRGLCRLALKGFKRAQADLELLLKEHPEHPQALSAQLGVAECLAAQRRDDEAYTAFASLWKAGEAPLAAQALWGAAQLRTRQSRLPEAKALYERLAHDYPASFEAAAAAEKLKGLAGVKAAAPTPTPAPRAKAKRYAVQVVAFGSRAAAAKLAAKLKAKGYGVRVEKRAGPGSVMYLVKAGPTPQRAKAEALAKRLSSREHLPYRIVEE